MCCGQQKNPYHLPFFELLTTLIRSTDVDLLKFLSRGRGRHIVAHFLCIAHKKLRAEVYYPNSEQVRRKLRIMPSRLKQVELEKLTFLVNTIYTVYITPNTPTDIHASRPRS